MKKYIAILWLLLAVAAVAQEKKKQEYRTVILPTTGIKVTIPVISETEIARYAPPAYSAPSRVVIIQSPPCCQSRSYDLMGVSPYPTGGFRLTPINNGLRLDPLPEIRVRVTVDNWK